MLASFGIVVSTEPKVTPVIDPHDREGHTLTAASAADHNTN
ncbi:hypothetical protein JOF56_000886 [Kibdelosporangium banguiense]|uniref:Uncharacterized protein n=1 Tax=Kibdelosporangium banguiense TaxID=1365924 RepID=A0ABS4T9J2_9PSEU|nr:hypothetical protein [Kibdelosporangium banguiense]MBP2320501.1 hypothetical protein [Kibdelosporangium banguiense]